MPAGARGVVKPFIKSLTQSALPGYSSTQLLFSPAKMQTLISNSMPGWMGACSGTCLLISSTRVPLCLPAGQALPKGLLGCSGCTPWSGYHLGAFIWSHVLQQFPLPWEESCLAAG